MCVFACERPFPIVSSASKLIQLPMKTIDKRGYVTVSLNGPHTHSQYLHIVTAGCAAVVAADNRQRFSSFKVVRVHICLQVTMDVKGSGALERIQHECRSRNMLWEDPEFPAAPSSLYYKNNLLRGHTVTWLRPPVSNSACKYFHVENITNSVING